MSVREKDNPTLFARIQEQNLLRQYDLLSNCIEIGLEKGIEAFDKYTLWALNYAAVSNISQFGGVIAKNLFMWKITTAALQGCAQPNGSFLFGNS